MLAAYLLTLYSRSILSLQTSFIMGAITKHLVRRDLKEFWITLRSFFVVSVCASFINGGIRFLRELTAARMRTRGTETIHKMYMANYIYYHLAQDAKDCDGRITQDLAELPSQITSFVGSLFKPSLDVLVSASALVDVAGVWGPARLYAYFLASGIVLTKISPAFGPITAMKGAVEAQFYSRHAKVRTHSEQIAFCKGENKESQLLHRSLGNVMDFTIYSSWLRFRHSILEQFVSKYASTLISYLLVLFPLVSRSKEDPATLVEKARTAEMLLQKTAGSIAEIITINTKLKKFQNKV